MNPAYALSPCISLLLVFFHHFIKMMILEEEPSPMTTLRDLSHRGNALIFPSGMIRLRVPGIRDKAKKRRWKGKEQSRDALPGWRKEITEMVGDGMITPGHDDVCGDETIETWPVPLVADAGPIGTGMKWIIVCRLQYPISQSPNTSRSELDERRSLSS